jgi:ribonucleoside-diphosphate reductase alpha chain
MARGARRIGLGITGLADMLVMMGLHYGSDRARDLAGRTMRLICHAAYRASVALAAEKGAFPYFDRDRYLAGAFVQTLPPDIRDAIAGDGIRNSHLVAIAPTGTISLLANNVSSGLEPVFSASYDRSVLDEYGASRTFELTDYAVRLWRQAAGRTRGDPPALACAADLAPEQHLAMQAALQPFVDNSISKTINVPEGYPFEAFSRVYDTAYDLGLKGCTTFRPNPVTGAVVTAADAGVDAPHCCAIEREPD